MTLLVRNEEDVLDYHLRYHIAEGVDFFIVTDNRSDDATPRILDRYRRKGVLYVINRADDKFAQARWVTHMARLAANALDADWVIHSDADEFFFAEQGTVRDALEAVPDEFGIVAIPRLNFRPRPETDQPFHERMVVRAAPALTHSRRKVCHRAHPRAVVTMGNHGVRGTRLKELPTEPIVIFHYPERTWTQFERKVRLGGRAVASNPALGPGQSVHWREQYAALQAGELRPVYDGHVLDEAAVEIGLRNGELVIDRRLTRRLTALPPGVEAPEPRIPADAFARLDALNRPETRVERARDRVAAAFWALLGRLPVLRALLSRLKRGFNGLKSSGQRVLARR